VPQTPRLQAVRPGRPSPAASLPPPEGNRPPRAAGATAPPGVGPSTQSPASRAASQGPQRGVGVRESGPGAHPHQDPVIPTLGSLMHRLQSWSDLWPRQFRETDSHARRPPPDALPLPSLLGSPQACCWRAIRNTSLQAVWTDQQTPLASLLPPSGLRSCLFVAGWLQPSDPQSPSVVCFYLTPK
jgi:hypothetical protein